MKNVIDIYRNIIKESSPEDEVLASFEKDSFGYVKDVAPEDYEDSFYVRVDPTTDEKFNASFNLNGMSIANFTAATKLEALQGMSNEVEMLLRKLEKAADRIFD